MLLQDGKPGLRLLAGWLQVQRPLAPWTEVGCGIQRQLIQPLAGTSPAKLQDMQAVPPQVVQAPGGIVGMRRLGQTERQQVVPNLYEFLL